MGFRISHGTELHPERRLSSQGKVITKSLHLITLQNGVRCQNTKHSLSFPSIFNILSSRLLTKSYVPGTPGYGGID